jgi:hypothetical protein
MQARIRQGSLLAIVSAGLVVVLGGAVFAQNQRTGTWKLNLSTSKYNPGPLPKSQTRRDEASNDGLKSTFDGVAADGSRIAYSYTVKYDGKDYPLTGTGTPNGADSIAIKRIDDYTFEATQKKAGKVVQTTSNVISKDGKTMTVTSKGTNQAGQPTNNVSVYDKQ